MKRLLTIYCAIGLSLGSLAASCPAVHSQPDASQTSIDEPETVVLVADGSCLRERGVAGATCIDNPRDCATVEIERQGDQLCETCLDAGGQVLSLTCGEPQQADCALLENSSGEQCSVCQAGDGTVYYDSCHDEPTTTLGASCEQITSADGQVCEICYDELGDVISRSCGDTSRSTCEVWQQDGQRCERCTDDSGAVSERCEPTPALPVRCEASQAPDGSACVTCYDEQGNVVDHGCSAPEPSYCDAYRSSDGAQCTVCYDSNNVVVSQDCTRELPPETCSTYREADGSQCEICTDAEGNVTHRSCQSLCPGEGLACNANADCVTGSQCVQGLCACPNTPPECQLFETQDGVLCQICEDLNNDGVLDERDATCFTPPPDPVNCREEQRLDASTGAVLVCTVCESQQGGTTETCAPQTGTTSPTDVRCEVQPDSSGQSCEVCYDSSGAVVHTSCSDLSCREEWISGLGAADVAVPCQLCERAGHMDSLTCDMQQVCAPSPSDPNQPPPPDPGTTALPPLDACGNTWLSREPVQCAGNPWEIWWRERSPNAGPVPPAQEGELIRFYYRETSQAPIEIMAYRIERSFDASMCQACDCPRGDVISIYVAGVDAEVLRRLGWR